MNNTTGANTVFGFDALLDNTAGFNNVAVGVSALLNNNGNNNTAIGNLSLNSNTTGDNHIVLGRQAGSGLTTVVSFAHAGSSLAGEMGRWRHSYLRLH
jgi:trimeric autotransporter adhesin